MNKIPSNLQDNKRIKVLVIFLGIKTHFPTGSEHNGLVLVIFQTEDRKKMRWIIIHRNIVQCCTSKRTTLCKTYRGAKRWTTVKMLSF